MARTSRDVARLAGVSQSTVSYVLTGKRPISAETTRRVLDAMEQLTFQPNAGARALASQRTNVIGLVVPFRATSDPAGLLPFIETIAQAARDQDHDVLLVTADEGTAALTRLSSRALVDAIVLMEIADRDERIEVAAGLRVPVVLVGVPEDARGLACVDLDFEEAGRLAARELIRAGARRIVTIGHSANVAEQGLGYVRRFGRHAEATAREAGLPLRLVTPAGSSPQDIHAAVEDAVSGEPGQGLLVPSSASVPFVVASLTRLGITAGADLPFVALCSDAVAEAMVPAVTNVSLEPRDVSRRAMRMLFEALGAAEGFAPAGTQLVTPRLTRRATT